MLNPFLLFPPAGGGGGGGTGWDPAVCDSKLTISGGDTLATVNVHTNGSTVFSKSHNSSGMRYAEIQLFDNVHSNGSYWFGAGAAGMALTGRPGFDFTGGNFVAARGNGQSTNQTGYTGAFGTSWVNGAQNVIMLAVDFSANMVYFGINGTFLAGISPGTGYTDLYLFFTADTLDPGDPTGGVFLATKTADQIHYADPGLGLVAAGYVGWE